MLFALESFHWCIRFFENSAMIYKFVYRQPAKCGKSGVFQGGLAHVEVLENSAVTSL